MQSNNIQHYNVEDGLQSHEFNAGASLKAQDERLFFGGINGYNVFNPKLITTNNYSPQLVITQLKLNNKIIEPNIFYLLDLVALGTICDVMPLSGLNRALVSCGLKIMQKKLKQNS